MDKKDKEILEEKEQPKDHRKRKIAEQAAKIKELTEALEQSKDALAKAREEGADIKDQHLRL